MEGTRRMRPWKRNMKNLYNAIKCSIKREKVYVSKLLVVVIHKFYQKKWQVSSPQCVKEIFFSFNFCRNIHFNTLYQMQSVVVNAALYTSALNSLSTENVSNLS